jgi:hypothetical protein
VYGRDHGVPHFHIEGPDFRCSVAIDSLDRIVGSAPPLILQEALAWAKLNQAMLMKIWRDLNG